MVSDVAAAAATGMARTGLPRATSSRLLGLRPPVEAAREAVHGEGARDGPLHGAGLGRELAGAPVPHPRRGVDAPRIAELQVAAGRVVVVASEARTLLTSTPAPTPYAAGAALAAHRSHLRRSCAAPARDSARSSQTPELAAMGTRACQCPRLPPCLYVAQCHACAYVYVQANKCTSTCRQRS